jgi:hypothetical protein
MQLDIIRNGKEYVIPLSSLKAKPSSSFEKTPAGN